MVVALSPLKGKQGSTQWQRSAATQRLLCNSICARTQRACLLRQPLSLADASSPYVSAAYATDGMTQASNEVATYSGSAAGPDAASPALPLPSMAADSPSSAAPAEVPPSNPIDPTCGDCTLPNYVWAQQHAADLSAQNGGGPASAPTSADAAASPANAASPADQGGDSAAGPANAPATGSPASPADAASPAAAPANPAGDADSMSRLAQDAAAEGPVGGSAWQRADAAAPADASAASPSVSAALDAAAVFLSDMLTAAFAPESFAASPDSGSAAPAPAPIIALAGNALYMSAMADLPSAATPSGASPRR